LHWQCWEGSTRSLVYNEPRGTRLQNKVRYTSDSDHVPLLFNIKVEPIYANNYHRWNVREFENPDSRKAYNEETNLQIDAIQWHEINSVEDLWTTTKKVIQNSLQSTIGVIKVQPNLLHTSTLGCHNGQLRLVEERHSTVIIVSNARDEERILVETE
jgi:hypothetical protein